MICTVSMAYGPKAERMTTADVMELVRVGGRWLITPTEANDRPSVVAQKTGALAHPELLREREIASAGGNCLSNLKQVVLGLLMFASDYDNAFKVTSDGWVESLKPYVKNMSLFHCPDAPGTGTSYTLNPSILGKSINAFTRPDETVLLYEGQDGNLEFRHEGQAVVGFVDGHCKLVSRDEAAGLRWDP